MIALAASCPCPFLGCSDGEGNDSNSAGVKRKNKADDETLLHFRQSFLPRSAAMAYLIDGKITGISGIVGPFVRGATKCEPVKDGLLRCCLGHCKQHVTFQRQRSSYQYNMNQLMLVSCFRLKRVWSVVERKPASKI